MFDLLQQLQRGNIWLSSCSKRSTMFTSYFLTLADVLFGAQQAVCSGFLEKTTQTDNTLKLLMKLRGNWGFHMLIRWTQMHTLKSTNHASILQVAMSNGKKHIYTSYYLRSSKVALVTRTVESLKAKTYLPSPSVAACPLFLYSPPSPLYSTRMLIWLLISFNVIFLGVYELK